jgi:hypothetical protein
MNDPDSVIEYVKWLDARHYRLTSAVSTHRANKQNLAIPGSIDEFDRHLWAVLDGLEDDDE